jgi:hypothetical protein
MWVSFLSRVLQCPLERTSPAMYHVDVHEHESILQGKQVEVMSVDGVELRAQYRRKIEIPGSPSTPVEWYSEAAEGRTQSMKEKEGKVK